MQEVIKNLGETISTVNGYLLESPVLIMLSKTEKKRNRQCGCLIIAFNYNFIFPAISLNGKVVAETQKYLWNDDLEKIEVEGGIIQ